MNGRRGPWVGLGALALLLWTPPANAVVYFDDGGTHVANLAMLAAASMAPGYLTAA